MRYTNRPVHPTYRHPDTRRNMGPVALSMMVVAMLALGAIYYALKIDHSTPVASDTPPTTTGQGSPSAMAPVIDEVKPAPTTPTPPANVDDPAKQGVDVEESPTMPSKP